MHLCFLLPPSLVQRVQFHLIGLEKGQAVEDGPCIEKNNNSTHVFWKIEKGKLKIQTSCHIL